jgi:hypothetical protein
MSGGMSAIVITRATRKAENGSIISDIISVGLGESEALC